MTTAARPTFDTARGKEKDLSALSKQYSSRDLPGHTKLKYRYVIKQFNQHPVNYLNFMNILEKVVKEQVMKYAAVISVKNWKNVKVQPNQEASNNQL